MSPLLAVNPASGRITSLGNGGNRFSSAIANPAPGAPKVSIRLTAQPATPSTVVEVLMPRTLRSREHPRECGNTPAPPRPGAAENPSTAPTGPAMGPPGKFRETM
ncbi:hypothetical protein GCM10018953_29520 [Streptosporangium nondiastaticum]